MDIEIRVPDIGLDEVEVVEILVHVNDYVEKDSTLIIVEGEKTSMEIPSPNSGVIKEIKIHVSDFVKTNSIIMIIDSKSNVNTNNVSIEQKKTDLHSVKDIILDTVHASPLVRRLSRISGINLHNITGSGKKNRIVKQDIDLYIQQNNKKKKETIENKKNDITDEYKDVFGSFEVIKLNKVKIMTGNVLCKNWSTIPHVTQFDEVDITDLEQFRQKYNKNCVMSQESKLTILSFIIKVVCNSLKKFPYFNSAISKNQKEIFLKKYINIGFAVDTTYGLIVPVIKNIPEKSLSEISMEIFAKSTQAREKKLALSDVQGGCFTISNLGGIGGTYFTPIINSSEAAILGVSKSFYKPVWNGEKFIPRLMLPISLSYDHRIIDGADGARFISLINTMLSDIKMLLI